MLQAADSAALEMMAGRLNRLPVFLNLTLPYKIVPPTEDGSRLLISFQLSDQAKSHWSGQIQAEPLSHASF